MNILCIDIGSGTQDALYYQSDQPLQNCPKFVLPSPARMVSVQIQKLTVAQQPVYLYGQVMGGGFGGRIWKHVEEGFPVAAHPQAALSLADDVHKLEKRGIQIEESCPFGYCPVYLCDFDPGFWRGILAQAGLGMPELVLAAAQDHGFHPQASNRLGRFSLWTALLSQTQGRVQDLLFEHPPKELTRLRAVQSMTGGGPVADTGAAAVLGALFDPDIQALNQEQGVLIVNVGNSHTIAFLVYQEGIYGIFEHHTGLLDPDKLWQLLIRFRQKGLDNQDVFADNGHGCMYVQDFPPGIGFDSVVVLGPRRDMLQSFPVTFPAPGGDMMLAGSFGLLHGWRLKQGEK
ncbi:MAG: DUF1786 domain-containing protein [Desulfovermiculus sp.]